MSKIDDFLSHVPQPQRAELERIRALVYQLVPEAEEVISYGIPGFKYKNKYMLGFSAYKDHLSLFPTSEPITVFAEELMGYKLSRGTIQFSLAKPLPHDLLEAIIQYRRRSIDQS